MLGFTYGIRWKTEDIDDDAFFDDFIPWLESLNLGMGGWFGSFYVTVLDGSRDCTHADQEALFALVQGLAVTYPIAAHGYAPLSDSNTDVDDEAAIQWRSV